MRWISDKNRRERKRRQVAARAAGERAYKPVTPCKHHPDALRSVANDVCVECTRLYARRRKQWLAYVRDGIADLW